MVSVFGLVHGFGFAGPLQDLGLREGELPAAWIDAARSNTPLGRFGSAEEMAAGSGAELVKPQDAYDLARKIILLRNSPGVREEMRQRGRAYVMDHHSKNVRLQKTLEVYSRCYRRRIFGDPHAVHG